MTGGFGQIDAELEADLGGILPPRRVAADSNDPSSVMPPADTGDSPSGQSVSAVEQPSKGAETDTTTTPLQEASKPSSQRKRRGRPPGSGASNRAGSAKSASPPLVLWAPKTIRSRMRALRLTKGTLYRDQVLDALEAVVDDIDDLVAAENSPRTVETQLFTRQEAPPPPVDRTQLSIGGMLQSQIDVIDGLVERTGATGRSQLVTIALNKYLPETDSI